jgi:hypothetical protein
MVSNVSISRHRNRVQLSFDPLNLEDCAGALLLLKHIIAEHHRRKRYAVSCSKKPRPGAPSRQQKVCSC